MKKILSSLIILLLSASAIIAQDNIYVIRTELGDIKIRLYDDTPKHRDNFKKLVDQGFYDGLLFHRVVKNHVIQTGDPKSRETTDTITLGNGNLNYTLDAEIRFPKYYNRRGIIGAARTGNDVNPLRKSSASQFYITTGRVYTDKELAELEAKRVAVLKDQIYQALKKENSGLSEREIQIVADMRTEERKNEVLFTREQKEVYRTIGGIPRLDGEYTVFGEVIEGMDVVDKIEEMVTNERDRPLLDIRIRITEDFK